METNRKKCVAAIMELSNEIGIFMPYIAVNVALIEFSTNKLSVLMYAKLYGLSKPETELLLHCISIKYSSIIPGYKITINKSQIIYGIAKYRNNGTITERYIIIVISYISLADFIIFYDNDTHELLRPESIVDYEIRRIGERSKTHILHVKDIDNTFIVTNCI